MLVILILCSVTFVFPGMLLMVSIFLLISLPRSAHGGYVNQFPVLISFYAGSLSEVRRLHPAGFLAISSTNDMSFILFSTTPDAGTRAIEICCLWWYIKRLTQATFIVPHVFIKPTSYPDHRTYNGASSLKFQMYVSFRECFKCFYCCIHIEIINITIK